MQRAMLGFQLLYNFEGKYLLLIHYEINMNIIICEYTGHGTLGTADVISRRGIMAFCLLLVYILFLNQHKMICFAHLGI